MIRPAASRNLEVGDDLGFFPVVLFAVSVLDGYAMAALAAVYGDNVYPEDSEAAKQLWRWKQQVEAQWFNVNKFPKAELFAVLQHIEIAAGQILAHSAEVRGWTSGAWDVEIKKVENNVSRDRDKFGNFQAIVASVDGTLVDATKVPNLIDEISNFVLDVRALMYTLDYAIANDALGGSLGGVVEAFAGLALAVADLFNALAGLLKTLLEVAAELVRLGAAVIKASLPFLPYILYGALALGLGFLGWKGYQKIKGK